MFLMLILLLPPVIGFLFHSDAQQDQCYELDLENCFREAFLAAMHPPFRRRKELGVDAALDKRKARQDFFLCHDVRRLSACFMYPGCTEPMAASMCDQACSRDSVFICRRDMSPEEQEDEQAHLREMAGLAVRIAADVDNTETCDKIKKTLIKVLSVRVKNCGDAARCTCEDSLSEAASLSCGINCEQLVNQEQRNQQNSACRLLTVSIISFFMSLL